MKLITYSNKAVTQRYICDKCKRRAGDDLQVRGAFFQVPCFICGAVGLHGRLTEESFSKARKAIKA